MLISIFRFKLVIALLASFPAFYGCSSQVGETPNALKGAPDRSLEDLLISNPDLGAESSNGNQDGLSIPSPSGNGIVSGSGGGGSGGSGGGAGAISVSGLSMSSAISLISAEEDQNDAGGAGTSKSRKGLHSADFDDPESDFSLTPSRFHVDMEALEPLDMANFIMCFMKQLAPSTASTLNKGPYLALVDEAECEKGSTLDAGSQTGNANAGQGTSYQSVIVESSRASESAPQIVKVWVLSDEGGEIRAETIAQEGVSEDAPYGIFTMNWAEVDPETDTVFGQGSLSAINEDPQTSLPLPNDGVGISFYMSSMPRDHGPDGPDFDTLFGEGARFVQAASAVMEPDETGALTNGRAITQMKLENSSGDEIDIEDRLTEIGGIDIEEFGVERFSRTFALSYNSDNMLIQKAPLYADLPFNDIDVPDDTAGMCFSRDEFDQAVWCYELFDATTGDVLDWEQGFPFSIDKVGCDLDEMWGYIGYWGMWYEGQHGDQECQIEDGDIIERRDYGSDENGGEYEIVKSKGKLTRHRVATLNLSELRGTDFEMWSLPGDHANFGEFAPEADPYEDLRTLRQDPGHNINSWVVNYLTIADDGAAADGFYLVGYKSWGDFGPELVYLTDITDPVGIAVSYDVTPTRFDGEQLWMFSQELGGDVRYTKDAAFITFNQRETVDPNDEIFGESGAESLALNCLFQCPKGDLLQSDLDTYDGPFEEHVEGGGLNPVSYTFLPNLMMLQNAGDVNIALQDGQESGGQYLWGLQSGPMVTADALGDLTDWWDVFNAPDSIYYTWETGTNTWNQAVFAKNLETDLFASFDRPIEFSYTHATADDRLENDTYDGKTFLLGYGGKCNLWGIPYEHVGQDHGHGRWYPAFGLKDGTIVGSGDQYVVKAIEGEQLPTQTPGECAGLTVTDPDIDLPQTAGSLPSHVASAAPDLSNEAPKVIAGEVQ